MDAGAKRKRVGVNTEQAYDSHESSCAEGTPLSCRSGGTERTAAHPDISWWLSHAYRVSSTQLIYTVRMIRAVTIARRPLFTITVLGAG